MVRRNNNISWGLFLLRFGLGLFLALWSLNKIISPDTTTTMFARFYWIDIHPSVAMIIGALELALSLLIMLGMYKTWTYGIGLIVQLVSTLVTFQELITPFGGNIYYVANLPIMFSFIALFLLRNLDNRWALTKKPKMFSS